MSLRWLGMLLVVPCLAIWACDDSASEAPAEEEAMVDEAATEEGMEAEEAAPGPKETCEALVEAAKAEDAEKVGEFLTDAEALGDGKAAVLAAIGGSTCGDAAIDEDGASATLPVTAGDKSRDLTFVGGEEGWKLDTAAYMEAYPAKKVKKGKKGKKGRKGKRRRRK